MPRPYIPELPEAEAEGRVAELYEDIRQVLGLPLVNLVYRHLAATGRLEAVWRQLRPNLAHPAVAAAAAELLAAAELPVALLSRTALADAGVGERELEQAIATLDAYNHANPRNLLAIRALLEPAPGAPGTDMSRGLAPGPGPGARPPRAAALPRMADPGSLDPPVRALLEEMARPFTGRGEALLVPGLFRHFADNPALLTLLWTELRPHVEGGGLARRASAVGRRARRLAATLPYPVRPVEEVVTREALGRFAFTLPRMIVAGTLLRRALG